MDSQCNFHNVHNFISIYTLSERVAADKAFSIFDKYEYGIHTRIYDSIYLPTTTYI